MGQHCSTAVLSLGFVLATGCVAWAESEHTARARVARARAEGRTEVNLGVWIGIPPEIASTDEALTAYTTAIIQPLLSKTYVEDGTRLITWYKVRVIQIFGQAASTPQSALQLEALPADITPTDLLPLGSGELLLLQPGGDVTIDGVKVSSHVKDAPPLSVFSRYLCFLDLGRDGRVATLPMLGSGIFEISGEKLRAVSGAQHAVVKEIQTRFNNSLRLFGDHARIHAAH